MPDHPGRAPSPSTVGATRAVWIASACVCALVSVLAALPLLAEVLSAVSGDHVWSLETVWFAVLPVAALVIAWVLAVSVRRARSLSSAIVRGAISVAVAVAGCAPLLVLFVTLLSLQFRPAP